MKLLKDIRQGAGYLEGFGDHPGTGFMVVSVIAGGVLGARDAGWYGLLGGVALMFCTVGAAWMAGCVGRAREYQRREEAIAQNEARAEEFSLRQAQFDKNRS